MRTDAKLIFCHAALPARAIKWKLSRHLRGIKVSFSTPRRRISSRLSLSRRGFLISLRSAPLSIPSSPLFCALKRHNDFILIPRPHTRAGRRPRSIEIPLAIVTRMVIEGSCYFLLYVRRAIKESGGKMCSFVLKSRHKYCRPRLSDWCIMPSYGFNLLLILRSDMCSLNFCKREF